MYQNQTLFRFHKNTHNQNVIVFTFLWFGSFILILALCLQVAFWIFEMSLLRSDQFKENKFQESIILLTFQLS